MKTINSPKSKFLKVNCPSCEAEQVVFGKISTKVKCNSCKKTFADASIKNKTYPAKIILNAVSYYNLGSTQLEVSKLLSQRYKVKVPQRTISVWVAEYKNICTFARLRKQAARLYNTKSIVFSKILSHI